MSQYVVVGDTEQYKECLALILCAKNKEEADAAFNRMLTNPTEHEERELAKFTNLQVKEIPDKKCWWLHGCD